MNTLILGLGNLLLGDEGIGVHAVKYLQQGCSDLHGVTFMDGGTLSFTLAGYIEQSERLIIIDAAQLHDSPGTVAVFENEDMDRFISGNANKSVHEVNVTDILSLAHLTGCLPRRRALIGIQPRTIDWSETLSEPVAQALPKLCKTVRGMVNRWDSERLVAAEG